EDDEPPPEGGTAVASSSTIEGYIELGGGYYLKAKEDVAALLGMVEMQDTEGIDLEERIITLDSALSNINSALETYDLLIGTAESTPYNGEVIGKLNQFDYYNFMVANGLNSAAFGKVEDYLKAGDITRSYKHSRAMLNGLRNSLNDLKDTMGASGELDLAALLELNESFSEFSLFGSYITRVFYAI
ncbi:MAG: hypothetical protein GY940_19260, partial [bacterium]|nr:hypothetical protein [bacterium]